MEQLWNRAEQFRKQGRLQNQDLVEIIKEIKDGEEFQAKDEDNIAETVAKDEYKCIFEAVKEGLLQVHGTAPNTKQQGIFRIMGKTAMTLIIELAVMGILQKHWTSRKILTSTVSCTASIESISGTKRIRMTLSKMFQHKLECIAVSAHNVHEGKVAGKVQEGGTGMICFGESTGYIKKTGHDNKGLGWWSWILLSGTNGHST